MAQKAQANIKLYLSFDIFRDSMNYIKERMAQLAPANIALRLICLLSQCYDGIPQADFSVLKQQFLQVDACA